MTQFRKNHISAAKLDAVKVLRIRQLYHDEGWSQGRLAREFRVSVGQIGRIVRNEAWQEYSQVEPESEFVHKMAKTEMLVTPEVISKSQNRLAELLGQQVTVEVKVKDVVETSCPHGVPYRLFCLDCAQGLGTGSGLDKLSQIVEKLSPERTSEVFNDLEEFLK